MSPLITAPARTRRPEIPPSARVPRIDGVPASLDHKEGLRRLEFAQQLQQLTPAAEADAPQVASETDGFEQVAGQSRLIKQGDAPQSITLPKEIRQGMDDRWDKSFPGGRSQEQGGIMVKNEDGSYGFKAGDPGATGTFAPNYADKGPDQRLVGSAHTHPYDMSEGGYTGVGFSGEDIANLIYERDRLKMVEAGGTEFVLVRTEEFQTQINGLDAAKLKALHTEITATWSTVYKAAKGKVPERIEIAVKATVSKYKLSYYKGKEGKLDRVETAEPAAAAPPLTATG